MNDLTIEALINSGTLHKFISKLLVQGMQWQNFTMDQLVVQRADHLKAFTTATCSVQSYICVLTSIETFCILDSSLNMGLGMPQLHKVNPHIDWNERTICIHRNFQWVSLPVCGTDKEIQTIVNAIADCKSEQNPVGPRELYLESASQFSKSLKQAD